MKILVACEFSGIVRDAFIKRGHNAISCDLINTESPGPHIKGDVWPLVCEYKWDLVIAHPPCTYLCNSGVRWLYGTGKKYDNTWPTGNPKYDPDRWSKMCEAANFYRRFLSIDKVVIENPIMHKYAKSKIGLSVEHVQIVQPWQFGHPETKAICLCLKGVPDLIPTHNMTVRNARIHKMSPGPERSKMRSVFYTGIAKAMAEQWG